MAALAGRQGGVISYGQLVELGFGRGAIEHWLATGRLHRIHVGVYALGHRAVEWKGRLMAAVLACGTGAVLSHRSAAAWWGILPSARAIIDVTTTGRRSRTGIDCHTVRYLDPRDHTLHADIPITTLPRTLLDLAEVAPPRRLGRAIEECERLRVFDLQALAELLGRSRGRRGLKPLREMVRDYIEPPPVRSELELAFLEFLEEECLPLPQPNASVLGYEVDMLWEEERVVVELDSFEYHRTRAAFERDRARDIDLQVAGYFVMRVTQRRLTRQRAELSRALRKLLRLTPQASGRP